jgi:GH15 family glucan-1,4-alpha-glucosidase
MPLRGFLNANDERMRSTVDRIRRELSRGGRGNLLARVSPHFDDGLRGEEGAFMLCSFWLVDNLIAIGELDEAEALLDEFCGYANDVGLFSEMVNPETGAQLGNFPQAFAHVAMINAAVHLQEARERAAAAT